MTNTELNHYLKNLVFKNEEFRNRDLVWDSILEKIQHIDRQKRVRRMWQAVSLAAAICTMFVIFTPHTERCTDTSRIVALRDGTEIEISPNSSVKYNQLLWILDRNVKLDGTAFFSVSHNGKGFHVHADMGTVSVTGTCFSVSEADQKLSVECTEGSVILETKSGSKAVKAGESAEYDGKRIVHSVNWPEYLEFTDAPVADVAAKIAEIYDLTIVEIPACPGVRFSGYISTQDMDEALDVLTLSCELSWTKVGNLITIKNI